MLATMQTPIAPPKTPARANPHGIAKVPDPKNSKNKLANIALADALLSSALPCGSSASGGGSSSAVFSTAGIILRPIRWGLLFSSTFMAKDKEALRRVSKSRC